MNTSNKTGTSHHHRPVEILFEDRDILVVDKAPGLLTMATERHGERTAYSILTDYVRKGCAKSRNRVFIVHRLDRETSGMLIFAKNEEAKFKLQDHWDETEKKYIAVVHGTLPSQSGTISSYLAENKALVVYSTQNHSTGKLSRTAYKVIKQSGNFSLLEIDLLTGRKHQIRVHLSETGNPVVGDRKYGRQNDHFKNLALHAKSIAFKHPYTGKQLFFETAPPDYFNWLMKP